MCWNGWRPARPASTPSTDANPDAARSPAGTHRLGPTGMRRGPPGPVAR